MFKKLLNYTKKKSNKEKKSSKKIEKTPKEKKMQSKKEAVIQYSANKTLTAEGWLRRQKKFI